MTLYKTSELHWIPRVDSTRPWPSVYWDLIARPEGEPERLLGWLNRPGMLWRANRLGIGSEPFFVTSQKRWIRVRPAGEHLLNSVLFRLATAQEDDEKDSRVPASTRSDGT